MKNNIDDRVSSGKCGLDEDSSVAVEPLLLKCGNDNRPYLPVTVGDDNIAALLDSGSNCTILGSSGMYLLKKLNLSINYDVVLQLSTADGQLQNTLGFVFLPIEFNNSFQNIKVLVDPTILHKLVLGIDFILKFQLSIDFSRFSYQSASEVCVVNSIHGLEALSEVEQDQLTKVVDSFKE